MSFTERLISSALTVGIVWVAVRVQKDWDAADFKPQISALQDQVTSLQNEKKEFVFSGQGGQVACAQSNDPVTSGKIFASKEIAGDAALRQLLTLDIANRTCTVQLLP